MEEDVYRTLLKASKEVLFKDRNSKFYGYAFPVKNDADIQKHLDQLKKDHHKARHWCYAYQLGKNYDEWRANDDGEPNNSAGMPIYGQIQSFHVTNCLVVVVRYFGGTKLGVSGLINAYRTAAQLALESAKVVARTINTLFEVRCEYADLNKVMRVIKEYNLLVVNQDMALKCTLTLAVRDKEAKHIYGVLSAIYGIKIKEVED